MKKLLIATGLLTGLVFLTQCKKEETAPTCDTPISFKSDVQPIIIESCASANCHSAAKAASGIVCETYDQISSGLKGSWMDCIKHTGGAEPMPIGAPKLSDEIINKLECWVSQGAGNN